MAASKKKTEDDVEVDEFTVASEPAKDLSARPNDLPIVTLDHPLRNSSFAERAKAAGRNKRVAESDSK